MKKVIFLFVAMMMCVGGVGTAGAMVVVNPVTPYTFDLGRVGDLDHSYYYVWGQNWTIPDGEQIVGAYLFFDDIRNWDTNPNDLYVHLLDNALTGLRSYWDNQTGGDSFASWSDQILLFHWEDLPSLSQDLYYYFTPSQIDTLTGYLGNSNFGLGFDPDCHYWNNGITLTIETSTAPIPGAIFLLGSGLAGLAGIRRRLFR